MKTKILKRIMLLAMVAFSQFAGAADAPPLPKAWHAAATEEDIQKSAELSKRLVDVPIVRSSKGCIGYLGQSKTGEIIVRHLVDKKGKPVCRSEFAYGPGTENDFK